MGVLLAILLILLVAALAGLAYAARLVVVYVGTDILLVGWRLFRQGMRRLGRLLSDALTSDQHQIVCRVTTSIWSVHTALHFSKRFFTCSAKISRG